MARFVRFSLLLPALIALPLRAQTTPPALAAPPPVQPAADAAAPAGLATAGATTDPVPRSRAISPEVAAQLAASRPKYAVLPPPPPPPPDEELPDLRETDKPKNTIVRLPKYVVQEPRPPVFRERDINTKQGLANLAVRRYLSDADRALNRFTLPLFHPWSLADNGTSNEQRALAMYADDERLKNMADAADQTNMVTKSNPAAGAKVKSDAQQTFMRWSDFGWNGGSPK